MSEIADCKSSIEKQLPKFLSKYRLEDWTTYPISKEDEAMLPESGYFLKAVAKVDFSKIDHEKVVDKVRKKLLEITKCGDIRVKIDPIVEEKVVCDLRQEYVFGDMGGYFRRRPGPLHKEKQYTGKDTMTMFFKEPVIPEDEEKKSQD
jgi:hypothetical protein